MPRKKKGYLNNPDLVREIILSKEQDKLTKEAEKMLKLLADRSVRKMNYSNPDDRDDCLSWAYHDLFKYWRNFNPEKSNNAFAYYTSIIFKGLAKGWNEIHPQKYKDTVSYDSHVDSDGIYSL